MSNEIKGAFTVRFLRTGDQIYVTKDIVKFDASGAESGAALFQAVDPNAEALSVYPNWATTATEQPCLKLGVKSAQGNSVSVTDVEWTYRGTQLAFEQTAQTSGTYKGWCRCVTTNYTEMFMCMAKDGYNYLRFIGNAASRTIISNQEIGYTITYYTNGVSEAVSGSEPVLIQQAGTDGYSVIITTPNSTLGASATSTVLTANCTHGTAAMTLDGTWSFEWYKDFVKIGGATSKTLTVYRDETDGTPYVDGSSVFSVKLMHTENGSQVVKAVDAQRVTDIADEWQVEMTPDGATNAISLTNSPTYNLTLKQNGAAIDTSKNKLSWSWDVYNAINIKTATGTSNPLQLTAEMAKCEPDATDTSKNYYSDVSVVVTVTVEASSAS